MTFVLRSKRVLVGEELRPADIVIEHDYVAEIARYHSAQAAYDLGDRLLAPGFVDLHSDAVEREIEPRPGAAFPIDTSLVELDKKLAMTGITTMFHAVAFNEEALVGQRGNDAAAAIVERIYANNNTCLTVDNFVHARYEITSFSSLPVLKRYIREGYIRLLSFMDHSPGQGQFKSLEKWKEYHMPVYELTESQVGTVIGTQQNKKARCMDYLVDLATCARSFGVPLASHDDDTCEKIDLMRRLGVGLAEFPLSLETAEYARQERMATGMGAPNVVRGRSQSGNISARDLVTASACDFLCSDYHPSSMLQAVYTLHRDLGIDLVRAFQFVTCQPASIIGLKDRARIRSGALADLIVVDDSLVPSVVLTIKSGKPIYSSLGCFLDYDYAA